jgi:hypothetical protein
MVFDNFRKGPRASAANKEDVMNRMRGWMAGMIFFLPLCLMSVARWIEVAVRPGEWIPVDPTTGEVGRFSASHVALWNGPGALAPDAGPMEIEVLAFARSGSESAK